MNRPTNRAEGAPVGRRRWVPVASVLAAVSLLAVPAAAHDDGDHHDDVMRREAEGYAKAAAHRAPQDSQAPRTFAPCVDGMAAGVFPCQGVDLLSWVDHDALGTSFVNDLWGWTDPQTGRDYALVGATEGTVFVDVTDPLRPRVLGLLPAHELDPARPFWRDIKVHANHAFIVSEQRGHGMQVFDLTQLRAAGAGYQTFTETAHYDGFSTAHNIAINEDSGYAYAVGTRNEDRTLNCGGGLHMIDISQPTAPSFAGCVDEHGYVHDTQCVDYRGPDADLRGREICFSSNPESTAAGRVNYVTIVDVTDKAAPETLSRSTYPQSGYSHQGWLTPDHRHFLHGDELDEVAHGIGTTTRVWDVSSLREPELIGVFENDTPSIDHNLYTQGRHAFASNYTSGLRVYDTRRVAEGELREVAWFDVYPENDNPTFEGGTWSNYPYFRQRGIVAVSSMDRGLFILQPRIDRTGR